MLLLESHCAGLWISWVGGMHSSCLYPQWGLVPMVYILYIYISIHLSCGLLGLYCYYSPIDLGVIVDEHGYRSPKSPHFGSWQCEPYVYRMWQLSRFVNRLPIALPPHSYTNTPFLSFLSPWKRASCSPDNSTFKVVKNRNRNLKLGCWDGRILPEWADKRQHIQGAQ